MNSRRRRSPTPTSAASSARAAAAAAAAAAAVAARARSNTPRQQRLLGHLSSAVDACAGPAFAVACYEALHSGGAPSATDVRHAANLCSTETVLVLHLGIANGDEKTLRGLAAQIDETVTKEFERIPDDDEDAPADALDYAAAAAAAAAAEDDDDGAGHWSQRSHEEERRLFRVDFRAAAAARRRGYYFARRGAPSSYGCALRWRRRPTATATAAPTAATAAARPRRRKRELGAARRSAHSAEHVASRRVDGALRYGDALGWWRPPREARAETSHPSAG